MTDLAAFLAQYAPLTTVTLVPEVRAHQAADVFALWQAWEELTGEKEQSPPFWAAVWPAAAVMARYLRAHPQRVQDRVVLEIGCGGGVASIAAVRAGARRVIANDIDSVALDVATLNAAANALQIETDGRDRCASGDFAGADLIVVADCFYERTISGQLLGHLRACSAEVLIADGGRAFAPGEGVRTLEQTRVDVNEGLEGATHRTVRLSELVR